MFFIAYTFKGQVHVFAGRVKIVSHLSCRTSTILKYFCPLIPDQTAPQEQSDLGLHFEPFHHILDISSHGYTRNILCYLSAGDNCEIKPAFTKYGVKHIQESLIRIQLP